VETTLEGASEHLKERTLGVEVFGREPAYDTSADPVVRTTAAQLRRRIAQYYSGPGHENEIVIELPAGGYMPEFRQPPSRFADPSEANNPAELVPAMLIPKAQLGSNSALITLRLSKTRLLFVAVLTLLALVGIFLFRATANQSALAEFWKPVLDTPGSILVCVGRQQSSEASIGALAGNSPSIREYLASNSVAWPDAITFSAIVGLIRAKGHGYYLRKSSATVFSDLRQSPAVLIGGFNNEWIMNLGAPLRFRYASKRDASGHNGRAWIEDQQNPSQRAWTTDFNAPFSSFDEDYGIITRVRDTSTEQITVIASGIAAYGTIAAGEFLTNEKYMKMVADRAPKGWDRKNVQVVFSTRVINGNSGPPHILATHFW
jgi:hypothetical protein